MSEKSPGGGYRYNSGPQKNPISEQPVDNYVGVNQKRYFSLIDSLIECNRYLTKALHDESMVREVCRMIATAGGYRRVWVYWNGGKATREFLQTGYEVQTGKTYFTNQTGYQGTRSFRLIYSGLTCGVL